MPLAIFPFFEMNIKSHDYFLVPFTLISLQRCKDDYSWIYVKLNFAFHYCNATRIDTVNKEPCFHFLVPLISKSLQGGGKDDSSWIGVLVSRTADPSVADQRFLYRDILVFCENSGGSTPT